MTFDKFAKKKYRYYKDNIYSKGLSVEVKILDSEYLKDNIETLEKKENKNILAHILNIARLKMLLRVTFEVRN